VSIRVMMADGGCVREAGCRVCVCVCDQLNTIHLIGGVKGHNGIKTQRVISYWVLPDHLL